MVFNITGKDWTRLCFYAVMGASLFYVNLNIWYSALNGWGIVGNDFNYYSEGLAELLIFSWGAFYFFVYTWDRIKQDTSV